MGMENYKKAIKVIEQNKSECYFAGQRSENDIILVEKALGLKFSGIYKEFLKTYGQGVLAQKKYMA